MIATDQTTTIETELDNNLGTISIRRVVFKPPTAKDGSKPVQAEPMDLDDDEPPMDLDQKKPINGYLEKPKRGSQCCVFLVNGQRQHVWDNKFITRDLGFKYLRNRMIVVVEVDGLRPEALSRIMQGSRHGFTENAVYDTISKRVIATLKGDPKLQDLENEAEAKVAELQAGDEAVRTALDQLIENHHEAAERVAHGNTLQGSQTRGEGFTGGLEQSIDVVTEGTEGEQVDGPVIVPVPEQATIRLKPNVGKKLSFMSRPSDSWPQIDPEALAVVFQPPVDHLVTSHDVTEVGLQVDMTYEEPEDLPEDEYPIKTNLRVLASFEGEDEPRICERPVVIKPTTKRPPKPPKPVVLHDTPTKLRVTSPQPIQITVGGNDVHVRLRWDGKDSLALGTPPAWTFSGRCTSAQTFPILAFSKPQDGKFETVFQVPDGIQAGEQAFFEVTATGPDGSILTTTFEAAVVEPPAPRKVTQKLPGGAERKPPYRLVVLGEDNWDSPTCWGANPWTKDEPGSYQEPTESQPLTIFINNDAAVWADYMASMTSGPNKKAESTIEQRKTKYTSHLAFHLWQMYEDRKQLANVTEDGPVEEIMRLDARRMASTMVMMMSVGH